MSLLLELLAMVGIAVLVSLAINAPMAALAIWEDRQFQKEMDEMYRRFRQIDSTANERNKHESKQSKH